MKVTKLIKKIFVISSDSEELKEKDEKCTVLIDRSTPETNPHTEPKSNFITRWLLWNDNPEQDFQ